MKKKYKDAWIKALRSGRYKQCREQLRDGEGYCCLGVLARINGSSKKDLESQASDLDDGVCITDLNLSIILHGQLSDSFLKKVGIKTTEQSRLIKLNDDLSYDFIGIADYIEDNL
jgi:hypothetical protein